MIAMQRQRVVMPRRLWLGASMLSICTHSAVGLAQVAHGVSEPPRAAGTDQPEPQVPVSATPTPTDPLLFKEGPWTIKLGLFAGSQIVAENNAFWGLSDAFAPTANYSKDRVWNEAWLVPSVRVDYAASQTLGLYAG
ncbi:MAG: hypothetical protein ACK5XO_06780, partial [Phycisphaerales bacterium]